MKTVNLPGSTTSQDPARFVDILVPVISLVLVIFFLSFLYASTLRSEVFADEEQIRSLTEELGTLHEQLRDALTARELKVIESSIPHPDRKDRDFQAIGDHVSVGWSYPDNYGGKYVNFEIDLIKLDCVETSPIKCERRYVTSAGASESSRIPTGSAPIEPGFYAWRVAPVPAATVINENLDADDVNPLSDWSNLGSFTLYRSLLERVDQTGSVRVGTNLEQDTRFSQRTGGGTIQGFDISLIYTLIEKCLDPSDTLRVLKFNSEKCSAEVDQMLARGRVSEQSLKERPDSCSKDQLCVALVPIQKWGDWQSALRRKEIDLFIGSSTATDSRETNGIRFTPGYLAFESRLYGHAANFVGGGANLGSWLQSKRTVGVIEGSTNEDLLEELCKVLNPKHECDDGPLVKIKFPSFPPMEHAMDLGEIDGVLIDETFVDHTDWIPLDGLHGPAWNNYIKRYIGKTRGREEIGIAVGVDDARSSGVRGEELYHALKDALASDSPITKRYIPALCRAYWENSPNNKFCGNGGGK